MRICGVLYCVTRTGWYPIHCAAASDGKHEEEHEFMFEQTLRKLTSAADHTLETKTSSGLTCAWLAARYSGWTGTLEVLKAEGADLNFAHR